MFKLSYRKEGESKLKTNPFKSFSFYKNCILPTQISQLFVQLEFWRGEGSVSTSCLSDIWVTFCSFFGTKKEDNVNEILVPQSNREDAYLWRTLSARFSESLWRQKFICCSFSLVPVCPSSYSATKNKIKKKLAT